MAESNSGGRNTMIIAVVAIVVVAAVAMWAMTRKPAEKRASTTEGSTTVSDKKDDADIKINLPDSVTIEAH
jgi:hypothetical protein